MLRSWLERSSQALWYGGSRWASLLIPLEWAYRRVVRQRRQQLLAKAAQRKPLVPVIVVGNITVGGTGKTPVVVHLVEALRERGLNVGVISRGYGSNAEHYPLLVNADTPVALAGDEPLLIALRTGVPVMIDPQRLRAYQEITAHFRLDVVISDDGLQHVALPRTRELVVIDGARGLGNGRCLPAGPMREPVERLCEVDAIWVNGELAPDRQKMLPALEQTLTSFSLKPTELTALADVGQAIPLTGLQKAIYGVAGIANPQRFFATLKALGYHVEEVVFPDHHRYQARDLEKLRDKPIVTTQKDAVKMRNLGAESVWVLSVDVVVEPAAVDRLINGILKE